MISGIFEEPKPENSFEFVHYSKAKTIDDKLGRVICDKNLSEKSAEEGEDRILLENRRSYN